MRFSRERTSSNRSHVAPLVSSLACAGGGLCSPEGPCGFTATSHSEGCFQLGCFPRSPLERTRTKPRFRVRPFLAAALRRVLWPLLTSAGSADPLGTGCRGSPSAPADLPG